MMTLVIIVHVIACIVLIGLVLIQRGRGGGLVESFQGVESMFGTKTNTFLARTTTILSIVFFFTCLSLAVLSVRQSKSLMRNTKARAIAEQAAPLGEPAKQEAAKTEDKAAVQASQIPEEAQTQEAPKAE
jgi:preprotein translocase subunit SecG